MRLFRRLARLAALTVLLGSSAAFAVGTSPASTAHAAVTTNGWVRIAHLSPKAPAMDMYMYPFGDPGHATVLRDVSYGNVSAYMAVSPGQYTVAMRGFGAPASSTPALTTSFMVSPGTAYTLAALGPDPGLRTEILQDQMTAPTGKTLVRVLQASLKENLVTVSLGTGVPTRQLAFGSATSYAAVSPGERTVQFTTSGEHAAASVRLTADTVHTIVVLDDPSGLKVDALTDAVGSQIMPKAGAAAGFGGTAGRPAPDPAPWLLVISAGTLLAAVGLAGLRRADYRSAGAR